MLKVEAETPLSLNPALGLPLRKTRETFPMVAHSASAGDA
jgi:hypothetical protein